MLVNVPENDTVYTDTNILEGEAYEYSIQSAANINISGYVYAGIKVPVTHNQGKILLLIDDTYQTAAASQLDTYKRDLVKEGWTVLEQYISRSQSIASVKQYITDAYASYGNTFKGAILMGHIPVPYSGNLAPDAHPDHQGAWPSDIYYADINNISAINWKDQSININVATDPRNHNLIGDGKYDVSVKTSNTTYPIFVSRIDVYDMPSINSDDQILFIQYLEKCHAYRSASNKFKMQGIVHDSFGWNSGEAFAQNGWRNISSLVKPENTKAGNFITDTKTDSYIWGYACGPGTYTQAVGVGTTNDFQSADMKSVFNMMYGSYFGDWDKQNNFLRAPLASPSAALVTCWAGRPNWFFHNMSLGEPIGNSFVTTVNNNTTYYPKGLFSGRVHQSLLGDATLKMYMFEAPTNVSVQGIDNNTKSYITWTNSVDAEVTGYYIYKKNSLTEEFDVLTPNPITDNQFVYDLNGNTFDPNDEYMVRAVKLEQTATGSFFNLSPGALSTEQINTTLPIDKINLSATKLNTTTNNLIWDVTNDQSITEYIVERSSNTVQYEAIASVKAYNNAASENIYTYLDTKPHEKNNYRIKAIDINGKVKYSEVAYLENKVSISEMIAYPVPFNQQLNVQFYAETEAIVECTMSDMFGRRVKNLTITPSIGMNTFQIQNIENLSHGNYLLVLYDAESKNKQMLKIQKQ
ncbi:MAG: hypothetical protein R2831_02465 [Chitinophagaceae bacterium]